MRFKKCIVLLLCFIHCVSWAGKVPTGRKVLWLSIHKTFQRYWASRILCYSHSPCVTHLTPCVTQTQLDGWYASKFVGSSVLLLRNLIQKSVRTMNYRSRKRQKNLYLSKLKITSILRATNIQIKVKRCLFRITTIREGFFVLFASQAHCLRQDIPYKKCFMSSPIVVSQHWIDPKSWPSGKNEKDKRTIYTFLL